MSLNGAITAHKTGDYTVTRRAAGTVVAGRPVAGATTTLSAVPMSIQPVTGRALVDAPEGRRADEMRLVLCAIELFTVQPGNESDLITYRGESWEVIKSEFWEHWGTSHCRAYIARRGTSV